MKLGAFTTVIALAATAASTSGCGSTTAHASAGQKTQQLVYYAFAANGRPVIRVTRRARGYCWTGSLAVARNDAWRCFIGRFIYDPCFSSNKARGIVMCPAHALAWTRAGLRITLTKGLPRKYGHKRGPSKSGRPWGIETTSGLKCGVVTGMTNFVGNRDANYVCRPGKQWLWGTPERNYNPWRIYVAPINARKLTRKEKIRTAWY